MDDDGRTTSRRSQKSDRPRNPAATPALSRRELRYRAGIMGEAVATKPFTGADDDALTFAVVSGSRGAERHLAAICAELSRALGRPVNPSVLASSDALRVEVEAGRAQIAWAPPLVAIELEDAGLVSVDVCCARGGQIDYHAAIFTQHASTIEKLADLKGRHVAWVDKHSSAGYMLPRTRMSEEGLDVDTLFAKESFLGTHARVACAVLDGEADVGATYLSLDPVTKRPVSAGWLEGGAGINGAFIVATVGPIPSDTIVFAKSIPAELKAAVVKEVMALPASVPEAMGGLLRADGFAAVPEAHFTALRKLLAAGKKA
jgi:phosphonate transport system substrate-binding protein